MICSLKCTVHSTTLALCYFIPTFFSHRCKEPISGAKKNYCINEVSSRKYENYRIQAANTLSPMLAHLVQNDDEPAISFSFLFLKKILLNS